MIRVEIYTAPSHCAPALVNDDFSGMESDDESGAKNWADSLPGPIVSTDDGPDGESGPGFLWYHDARPFCPYGAECSNYVIHVYEKEKTNV